MPLTSRKAHRLFYMTDNNKSVKRGSRLIITPFLHERKIYHHEMEEQEKCFYNVLNSNLSQPLFSVLINSDEPVLKTMYKNGVL